LPKKCAKSLEIAKAISRMARDQLSKAKTPPRLRRFLTLLIAFAAPISFFNPDYALEKKQLRVNRVELLLIIIFLVFISKRYALEMVNSKNSRTCCSY
jgi:hypothetical protein